MFTMLFVVLGIALLLTVPIAVSLALTSAIVILTFYPGSPMMKILAQAMVTTSDSFPLMAIPFFMLVGIIMEKTGIAMKLVRVGEAIAGSVPGGLGAAAVLACMFFAAISGSGPASVAAIGTIMIPAMVARGYERDYSGSLLAAASTVGPVIPPSIPMIVYGATIGVSVIELFTAGIVPGILMGAGLLVYNYTISKKRGYVGVARKGGLKWVLAQLWDGKWALLMPVIVLGGIYGGVFSPTEAAVIGVLYALLIGWLQKELTYKKLADGLIEAACLSSIVMIVLGGATTFGRLLTIEHIPQMLAQLILGITDNPLLILLIINCGLLISGMFIDTISNIVLLSPLFVPIIIEAGYDPVFFGVLMTVNLCIGFLTPPLGVNLFVAQGVAGVSFEKIVKQVVPMIVILVIILVIMIAFPDIIMFLPRLLGK